MKLSFFKIVCFILLMPIILSSCSIASNNKVANNTLVIKNGTLIDGTGAAPIANSTIIIENGLIKEVGETAKISIPSNAKIINLKGATILPGFINAHVHGAYSENALQKWLKSGITTVRELGPIDVDDYLKKRDVFNDNYKNSSILSANPILAPQDGYGDMYYNSPEDARKKVLELIENGVDTIKFSIENNCQARSWPLPTYDEVKSIVDTAHSKHVRVAVHITHTQNLQWAIDAGADEIAHMDVDPLDSATIKKMVDKNIYWVPTLELWKGVSEAYSINYLNIAIDNLTAFYNAGGKIALGTDFAGYTCKFDEGFPITEVTLMKKAKMSEMDIIVAGTKNAAYTCGVLKDRGTLEVGKKADILIVNGNPLSDINALTKTKMVIHNGKIV